MLSNQLSLSDQLSFASFIHVLHRPSSPSSNARFANSPTAPDPRTGAHSASPTDMQARLWRRASFGSAGNVSSETPPSKLAESGVVSDLKSKFLFLRADEHEQDPRTASPAVRESIGSAVDQAANGKSDVSRAKSLPGTLPAKPSTAALFFDENHARSRSKHQLISPKPLTPPTDKKDKKDKKKAKSKQSENPIFQIIHLGLDAPEDA